MNKIKVFFDKLKENKKIQFILIVILGVICLFLLLFTQKSKNDSFETKVESDFSLEIENKLRKTLSKIEGVGEVNVVISFESGMETVLAMKTVTRETLNGTEIEETPILVNGKTVTIREQFPKIKGVLIVAKGADKLSIRNKLEQATASLFQINVSQIEILSM